MKKVIRLTESDVKNIIKQSVKRMLKEAYGESEQYTALIYDGIIEDYKVEEMAEEMGCSPEEAAMQWFKEVSADGSFDENQMPKHRELVMEIPEADAEMYHDYGAGYYFLVKKDNENGLGNEYTYENKIRKAVFESINKLMKEDYPFSPDEDKADKIDRMERREKDINDHWKHKNAAIRKKYPGKSKEWYNAFVDTFNESTLREDAGAGATNAAGVMQGGGK